MTPRRQSSIQRIQSAAGFFAEYLWRPSGEETWAIAVRARERGTTRNEEELKTWVAALLLVRDEVPGALTGDRMFRAAAHRVREDLLGLTRRQRQQADRATGQLDDLPARTDGIEEACESASEVDGLRRLIATSQLLSIHRHWLGEVVRYRDEGKEVPPKLRMRLKRLRDRYREEIAELRQIYTRIVA